jgi:hypothetical protein
MTTRPEDEEGPTEKKAHASTPQLDRLESLAKSAETAAQAKQWRARKAGLPSEEEPSEVRNLNHDAEARAQAEAAMQQMMAKGKGKKPSRW